jgi:LysR family transcriptional regulator for metE and metH
MDPRLEVRHLRLLEAVAEVGGLTRASRQLHVTQSALSHQLRDAEDRVGTPLFLRVKKRLVLTAAGDELLASARRVLAEMRRVEGRLQDLAGGEVGTLRLATECYTCYHWLPPLLGTFRERFPRVEVRIELDATRRTVPAVLEGQLDLGIVSSEPEDPRLALRPLFEDELAVVLPRGHPLTRRRFVRPQDLATETVFIYPPREESLLLNGVLGPAGVQPARVMEVPLTEAILQMVASGLGVAFLARWAVAGRLRAAGLSTRPLGRTGHRRRWQAASLAGRNAPAYLDAFVDVLVRAGRPAS